MTGWVWIVFGLASLPAAMTCVNLFFFKRLLPRDRAEAQLGGERPRVSLLIPARNEQDAIGDAVRAALASEGVELEVIVLDDASTDRTAAVVQRIAREDPRVRLEHAPALPAGWCGKQHACWRLAGHAGHGLLAWVDADVRLRPDALVRMAAELSRRDAAMVSGFPHQATGTLLEKLIVHLIPLVLLGYLPMWIMRGTTRPGAAAGCGQLVMAEREAYFAAGGHEAIKGSMHDGITLPRAVRLSGRVTDTFDAGDAATCRMYRDAGEVWRGFAKNATEGMAGPIGVWVWTVLLLGGHVLPWLLVAGWLVAWPLGGAGWAEWQSVVLWGAWLMSAATSLGLMYRFHQPWVAGVLRPVGVTVLIAIQWWAWGKRRLGIKPQWRGRGVAEA